METRQCACISRALGTLENDFALENNLLKPLRLMTSLQVVNALQFDLKQCCAFFLIGISASMVEQIC